MNAPQKGDYIDFHVHDGKPSEGVFILESLMAHEGKRPTANSGVAYTMVSIHGSLMKRTRVSTLKM
jgi:hypothetical protein